MYSPTEEKLNIWSHALGLLWSVLALIAMILKAWGSGFTVMFSVTVYGFSLCCLYAASTYYHKAKDIQKRKQLRIFDHAAIYILIAGTYTPVTLITLKDSVGGLIFGLVWGMAFIGVVLKVFFTGRFNLISTLMYVGMGWLIIFAFDPLIQSMSEDGLFWLFLGGVFYTIGALLYSIKKLPFNHAIFHAFVLLGSFSHFICVFYYVLP